ncbi:hypothetical protein OEIGOIKO_03449 [Streptomyces chrestomyceticus JCM 4735]|uniref:Uncharacterized protein n=1 Tax=Streptomyces chrestomyceticus JCM 4735 TaxID=1306181 RepID=A0A7U9KW80_9ACTN|nr:hypothetical protein [Streptomyces chrestomyceticus]GCD35703.1 hypothetical protein OEIGOIKO_03449 [Streptomyces chrestomyceticus JCM 4735]
MDVSPAIKGAFSGIHRIDTWFGACLLRALTMHLIVAGTWRHSAERGLYCVRDRSAKHGLCHQMVVGATGLRAFEYRTGHRAARCGLAVNPPPEGARSWLPPARGELPPADSIVPWRYLLSFSSSLPVRMNEDMVGTYVRLVGGGNSSMSIADAYVATAHRAAAAARLAPDQAGRYEVSDGDGLLWQVLVDRRIHEKPLVRGVRLSVGRFRKPVRRMRTPGVPFRVGIAGRPPLAEGREAQRTC